MRTLAPRGSLLQQLPTGLQLPPSLVNPHRMLSRPARLTPAPGRPCNTPAGGSSSCTSCELGLQQATARAWGLSSGHPLLKGAAAVP